MKERESEKEGQPFQRVNLWKFPYLILRVLCVAENEHDDRLDLVEVPVQRLRGVRAVLQ